MTSTLYSGLVGSGRTVLAFTEEFISDLRSYEPSPEDSRRGVKIHGASLQLNQEENWIHHSPSHLVKNAISPMDSVKQIPEPGMNQHPGAAIVVE